MNPIWKDYFVTLGQTDAILFRIKVGDDVIYTGKSYLRPGETDNKIRINEVCADYLINVLPTLSQAEFTSLDIPITFVVQKYASSAWSDVESVQFYNDWSYDNAFDPSTMGLAAPINGHIDARQGLIYTAYEQEMLTADITLADGTSFPVYVPIEISDDFNNDFNDDFSQSVRAAGSGTAVFDLSEYGDVKSVTLGNQVYKVVSDCKEWALYYVNAYGGWDTFLIEGSTAIVDNLTRHTREMEYDNSVISNRGRQNYVNEIGKVYTMHTGLLNDDEASRMHHLLNSTEVYLYNINSGEMIPVTLNNTQTEYKTFKGNGAITYTIEATLAQDRIRR